MMMLSKVKRLTIQARANYQLPKYLCYLILNLKKDDDIEKIKYLLELSEHYFRIKGYYKKYANLASKLDVELKKEYERRYPLDEHCLK